MASFETKAWLLSLNILEVLDEGVILDILNQTPSYCFQCYLSLYYFIAYFDVCNVQLPLLRIFFYVTRLIHFFFIILFSNTLKKKKKIDILN